MYKMTNMANALWTVYSCYNTRDNSKPLVLWALNVTINGYNSYMSL